MNKPTPYQLILLGVLKSRTNGILNGTCNKKERLSLSLLESEGLVERRIFKYTRLLTESEELRWKITELGRSYTTREVGNE